MQVYIFIGTAGTGKGTQAKLLSQKLNVTHVSTGDLFRSAVKNMTPVGKRVKSILDAGELVSDELVNDILSEYLNSHTLEKIVLDGYPRTLSQANYLSDYFNSNNSRLEKVMYFKLSKSAAVSRITGRMICKETGKIFHKISNPPPPGYEYELVTRDDDSEENASKRYEVFIKETSPLIDYYRDYLVELDVSLPISSVYNQLEDYFTGEI